MAAWGCSGYPMVVVPGGEGEEEKTSLYCQLTTNCSSLPGLLTVSDPSRLHQRVQIEVAICHTSLRAKVVTWPVGWALVLDLNLNIWHIFNIQWLMIPFESRSVCSESLWDEQAFCQVSLSMPFRRPISIFRTDVWTKNHWEIKINHHRRCQASIIDVWRKRACLSMYLLWSPTKQNSSDIYCISAMLVVSTNASNPWLSYFGPQPVLSFFYHGGRLSKALQNTTAGLKFGIKTC